MINILKKLYEFKNRIIDENTKTKIKKRYLDVLKSASAAQTAPVIVISVCVDEKFHGGWKHNGGVKLYNLWVNLLIELGYKAYFVTFDGKYEPWMVRHCPCISIKKLKELKNRLVPIIYIGSWAIANEYHNNCDFIYYYDCELRYTIEEHKHEIRELLNTKICKISTHSRTQQAWYMETLGQNVQYIPIWMDEKVWFQNELVRNKSNVGYFKESKDNTTINEIKSIETITRKSGLDLNFIMIKGDEAEIRNQMQMCNVFLGMNRGKHNLWGEGSPLSQLEAMHAGCVVIAYDVNGNREYLIDEFNGIITLENKPTEIGNQLVRLLADYAKLEEFRKNALALSKSYTAEQAAKRVRHFLDLDMWPFPDENYRTNIDSIIRN